MDASGMEIERMALLGSRDWSAAELQENLHLLGSKSYSREQLRAYRHRGLYLAIAMLQSVCSSGTIYGWPAFLLMLRAEHIYADRCGTDPLVDHHHPQPDSDGVECAEQEILFNRIATAGISSLLISLFVMGLCLDRFGPRVTACSGSFLTVIGALLVAYSDDKGFDYFVVAFSCLGFGGLALHLGIIHLANLFPGRKSLLLAAFNGAFAISGLLFLFLQQLNLRAGLSRESMFVVYSGLLVLICISSFFIWPTKSFTPMTDVLPTKAEGKLGTKEDNQTDEQRTKRQMTERIAKLKELSFWQQLCSAPWWTNAVFTAINIFGLQYYISTGPDQLLRMGDTDASYTVLLNIITPLGALGIPLYGWLMDKKGFAVSYAVINILGIAINVLALIPMLQLQVVTFALWAAYRLLAFSGCYAFTAKVFGDDHFGTLNGLTLSSAGILNFSQIVITKLVVERWEGSFFYPNVGFIVARLPLFWVSLYFWRLGI